MRSEIMSKEDAQALQYRAIQSGVLLIWTVTRDTADFPEHCVARPHAVAGRDHLIYEKILIAESLAALREQAPAGLAVMAPRSEDDPVIVETWI